MKGKINAGGDLSIQRGSVFKYQCCLYNLDEECGDWCPQFGEPTLAHYSGGKPYIALWICQNRVLTFKELEDLRK